MTLPPEVLVELEGDLAWLLACKDAGGGGDLSSRGGAYQHNKRIDRLIDTARSTETMRAENERLKQMLQGRNDLHTIQAGENATYQREVPKLNIRLTTAEAQLKAAREALERLHTAVRSLSAFEGKITLFEASPTKSDRALVAWNELDGAQKQAASTLSTITPTGDEDE